jgi:hypothetical protein
MELEMNWGSVLLVAFAAHLIWDVLKWTLRRVFYHSTADETDSTSSRSHVTYSEDTTPTSDDESLANSLSDEDEALDSIADAVNKVRHRRKKNKSRSQSPKNSQGGLGHVLEKLQHLTHDKEFIDRMVEKSKELSNHSEFLEKESLEMVVDMVQKICHGETPDLDRLESLNEKLTQNFSHFFQSLSGPADDKDLEQDETRDSEIVRQRLAAVLQS